MAIVEIGCLNNTTLSVFDFLNVPFFREDSANSICLFFFAFLDGPLLFYPIGNKRPILVKLLVLCSGCQVVTSRATEHDGSC